MKFYFQHIRDFELSFLYKTLVYFGSHNSVTVYGRSNRNTRRILLRSILKINTNVRFRLDDLVLSKVPSKVLQPNFVTKAYKEFYSNNQSSKNTPITGDHDIFMPLVLRSFSTMDDSDVLKYRFNPERQLDSKVAFKRKTIRESASLPLIPLSLGQLRLTLFIIDCYLIATLFYNTYIVLREMLVGKRLVVDASSYLRLLVCMSDRQQVNGGLKLEDSDSSRFHEIHYQCGHSPVSKVNCVSPSDV